MKRATRKTQKTMRRPFEDHGGGRHHNRRNGQSPTVPRRRKTQYRPDGVPVEDLVEEVNKAVDGETAQK